MIDGSRLRLLLTHKLMGNREFRVTLNHEVAANFEIEADAYS
jgi:hypothetical protein